MTVEPISRELDRTGWLELTGLGLGAGLVITLEVVQLFSLGHHSTNPAPNAWLISATVGVVACAIVMLVVSRDWNKRGGRRLQRLGRHAWRTGRLPTDLPTRVAVLRDLERRERKLDSARLPVWVNSLIWTFIAGLNLSYALSPLKIVTWVAIWLTFLATSVLDLIDRRQRPQLHRLVTELRQNPVPAS